MAITDLFRSLASAILPPGVERRSGQSPTGAIEGQSFADLLASEKSGKLSSARGVNIRPEAGVKLSPEQLARIGTAIDKAEAAGAQNALVMIDGMALKVNVGVRQVVEQVDMQKSGVMTGIDAVIPAGDQTGADSKKSLLPSVGFHPNLAKILQGKDQAAA
ncbi:MAG: hypothetical protein JSS51_12180 [Planctomycetes bacterium]|nr:hypothetical protein [Planctomycetota bacterium]